MNQLTIIKTKELTEVQAAQINELWNEEYPAKLADRFPLLLKDVARYDHYIIEHEQQEIMAWAVDFDADNETRFSIIVRSKFKQRGLGRALINRLKADNKEFSGWVIDHDKDVKRDGSIYLSPLPFYLKQGFTVLHDKRIDNEMLSAVKIYWRAL